MIDDFLTRKALPQDLRSGQEAAPTEQSEVASSDYEQIGASLPGSPSHEEYNYGVNYNGVSSDVNAPSGSDFGDLSRAVGVNQQDVMQGLDSDGFKFFSEQDREHPVDTRGMDTSEGLAAHGGIVPIRLNPDTAHIDEVYDGR